MTTNTYGQSAIIKLKNIIDKAWDEILKPEHRDTRKKIALATGIIIITTLGILYSVQVMKIGYDILIATGVSEILLLRIFGSGACIVGLLSLRAFVLWSGRSLRHVFNGNKKKDMDRVAE